MGFLSRLFGKKKKDVPKYAPEPAARRRRAPSKPDFPLGKNIVDDPDVKTIADLERLYPLPGGFSYRQDEQGVPYIYRADDGKRFHFLIEADMLTFDERLIRPGGKVFYKTTEVIKHG